MLFADRFASSWSLVVFTRLCIVRSSPHELVWPVAHEVPRARWWTVWLSARGNMRVAWHVERKTFPWIVFPQMCTQLFLQRRVVYVLSPKQDAAYRRVRSSLWSTPSVLVARDNRKGRRVKGPRKSRCCRQDFSSTILSQILNSEFCYEYDLLLFNFTFTPFCFLFEFLFPTLPKINHRSIANCSHKSRKNQDRLRETYCHLRDLHCVASDVKWKHKLPCVYDAHTRSLQS